MTEARKRAAGLAAQIKAKAALLPEGVYTTIHSGWRSEAAGVFPVDIHINVSKYGCIVDYTINGSNRSSRYIENECKAYSSLNWSEADCIHLVKAGKELVDGIDKLACEMMLD